MVFGTDLLGDMHRHQLREFELRAAFQEPIEIWRSATTVAADLFKMSGTVGVVAPGAHADLLVDDRNPIEDLSVTMNPDQHLKLIAKGGWVAKSAL